LELNLNTANKEKSGIYCIIKNTTMLSNHSTSTTWLPLLPSIYIATAPATSPSRPTILPISLKYASSISSSLLLLSTSFLSVLSDFHRVTISVSDENEIIHYSSFPSFIKKPAKGLSPPFNLWKDKPLEFFTKMYSFCIGLNLGTTIQ